MPISDPEAPQPQVAMQQSGKPPHIRNHRWKEHMERAESVVVRFRSLGPSSRQGEAWWGVLALPHRGSDA